ncbi:hypothetical protein DRW42_23020 [Pedobacter miscanthi]|uniref:Uncharacterized protein n=1 Tax=Pedobacter miscanthi TaxID=2259170 RepID=A0A366KNL8_9SPHI|nr:hypothetical protein DRW42_23020 [Pedobacter miscanthi]
MDCLPKVADFWLIALLEIKKSCIILSFVLVVKYYLGLGFKYRVVKGLVENEFYFFYMKSDSTTV